jgi:hypothetical protein
MTSLPAAISLLPKITADAIKRNPRDGATSYAAISLTTTRNECQADMEIIPEMVDYFCYKLFGVRVEVQDGFRYLSIDGVKVSPYPKLTLRNCTRDLRPIFGDEFYEAISKHPVFQSEEKDLRKYTKAVSMVISNHAGEGAQIYASMGLWPSTVTSKRLYPSYSTTTLPEIPPNQRLVPC